MSGKSPDIRVRGIRQTLPSGYILGRLEAGAGPARLISLKEIGDALVKHTPILGKTTFLQLTDTPDSYTGHARALVGVNAGETALEFTTTSNLTGLLKDLYGPPLASLFPTIVGTNSQSPTVADVTNAGTVITFGDSPASGDNVRLVLKAIPTSLPCDIICRFRGTFLGTRYKGQGLAIYQNGGSPSRRIITFGVEDKNVSGTSYAGTSLQVNEWTATTTFGTSITELPMPNKPEWFKIHLTSTTYTCYVSDDGVEWVQVSSANTYTSIITPTHVGFYVHENPTDGNASAGSRQYMQVLYYKDPDINPAASSGIAVGAAGAGVPAGGSTHQFLRKINGTDFNTEWAALDAAMAEAIHADTGKTTPVDADELALVDSAASNGPAKLTWANLKATLKTYLDTLYLGIAATAAAATKLATARNIDGQAFDGTANITVIAPGTHAASSKTTPVTADEFPLVDSAAGNALAKVTYGNLSAALTATLQASYDTRYLQLTGGTLTGSLTISGGGIGVLTIDGGTVATSFITQVTGGAAVNNQIQGEGPVLLLINSTFAGTGGDTINFRKSRGTLAAPTDVIQNDLLGRVIWQGRMGGANQNSAFIDVYATAATPSNTARNVRMTFNVQGATGAAVEVARLESDIGLSMHGANPVIGPNRHFWLREYAAASLPSATQSSMLASSSDVPGGAITSDGVGWHHPGVKRLRTVTANTSFSVPPGWAIAAIHYANTTANVVTGGVRIGTTTGATDVVVAQAIGASAIGTIADANVLKKVFSRTVAQTLFVEAVTSWNSASVEFSFVLTKVF